MQYLDLIILFVVSAVIFALLFYKILKPQKPEIVKIGKKEIANTPKNKEQIANEMIKDITSEIQTLYKAVIDNYVKGNIQGLAPLVSTTIYRKFYDEIKQNQKKGDTFNIVIKKIKNIELSFTPPVNAFVQVNAKIITQQLRYKMDKNKKVIEGNAKNVITLEDNWIFEKGLKDKNWYLKTI